MEVNFKLNLEDYGRAISYIQASALQNSKFRYLPFSSTFFTMILVGAGLMTLYRAKEAYPYLKIEVSFWMLLAGFILFLALQFLKIVVAKRTFSRPNGISLKQQSVEIDADFLVHTISKSVFKYAWSDIVKVEHNENYIFVFIDSMMAAYIPMSAFTSSSEAKEFLVALNENAFGNKVAVPASLVETGTPKPFKVFVIILVVVAIALTVYNKLNGH